MNKNTLHFHCPHCSHAYEDDFELLDLNQQHHFICEGCHGDFFVTFLECDHCTSESVHVSMTSSECLDAEMCKNCHRPIKNELEDEDSLKMFHAQIVN